MYSTSIAPIFFGSSVPVFFCGMPTTAVGPVEEAIRPTFICAWAASAAKPAIRRARRETERSIFTVGGSSGWKEPAWARCGRFTLEVKQCSLARHGSTSVNVAAAPMKIAILGGGHGCYAAAADLSEAGHEVVLWRRDTAALAPLVAYGSIILKDVAGARAVPIAGATAHISVAVSGAELIVIASPASAQDDIARALAPHLVSSQVVFLPPGTFGSFAMAQIVRAAGNPAEVAWAETGTLPYLARKHGEREVNITVRAVRLPTGVYPARSAQRTIEVIRKA